MTDPMSGNSDIVTLFPDLRLEKIESLQALWSGYGEIARYYSGTLQKTVVIKHVSPPTQTQHPRGWNTPLSHQRKIKSYQVELAFYREYNRADNPDACTPKLIDFARKDEALALVLEDLDANGFANRHTSLDGAELDACINWLAAFHAQFLQVKPENLWCKGTYWHLATRPDEFEKMAQSPLKEAASDIDRQLNQARFQTLVHGDAKLANFCFSHTGSQVAALDFQYVGGGVGVKDLMLLFISFMPFKTLQQLEEELLDGYFAALRKQLERLKKTIDFAALEQEWRRLYPFACADYHRFLAGWMPDHARITPYLQAQTQKCLAQL